MATTLNIVNNKGSVKFDSYGVFETVNQQFLVNSKKEIALVATNDITIKNTPGDIELNSNIGQVSLIAGSTGSNAIFFNAENTSGGITANTGTGGFTVTSNSGDINLLSQGSNVNIGVSPIGTPAENQTQNVNIESFNDFNVNSGDMYFVSSDVISFISLTGDIEFGSGSGGTPVIKFQDGNLLVNQSSSILDRQVDIAVTDESASKPGYNGLVINTFMSNVASDITLQTSNSVSDTQCILSAGVFPGNDIYAYYQAFLGYQDGDVVIRTDGPSYSPNRSYTGLGFDFTKEDINKKIYWAVTKREDTILSLGSLITDSNDPSNITVSGTYTGDNSRIYLLQIDSVGGVTDTFKWSNNGGSTWQQIFVPVSTSNIPLEDGILVQFTATTGYSFEQQFTFQTKITAIVGINSSIPTPETFYTIQPYHAYIKTETPSDIVIKTNNSEKMRITGDGAIGIQQRTPTACLDLDSNYGKILTINQVTNGYQVNPSITPLQSGGYVIVWNSQNNSSGSETATFDVYAQRYLTDGTRYGTNFKVNNFTTANQSFPFVAESKTKDSNNYIVTWASNSTVGGDYNIYAQIYADNSPVKPDQDILVNYAGGAAELNDQLYPKATGLANGNYVVVWASNESGTGILSIQGQIILPNGNFVGSKFQISAPSATTSRNYPYIAGLAANDSNYPGGFVCAYMKKVDTSADSRYTIAMRIFNSSGVAVSNEIDVTTVGDDTLSSISDGLLSVSEINTAYTNPSAINGGFVLAFYRNYQADVSLYADNDSITGLQSGATAKITSRDGVNKTITIENISNRFLIQEQIEISSSVIPGTIIEKIKDILFLTTTTAIITLDTGNYSVIAYRFNSDATSANDAIWIKNCNTSMLYEDLDRSTLPNTGDNIFQYKRPFAGVTVDNDGHAVVTWTNGSIPSIYYQILDVTNGDFIGTETKLTNQYSGLKQRNQSVTHLHSIQGNDYGFVITWDNQSLDLNQTGIYQSLVGYEHSIVNFEDGNNNLLFNHQGQIGVNTIDPLTNLHICAPPPSNLNLDPVNPAGIIVQNTSQHVITTNPHQFIKFMDGTSNLMANMQIVHAHQYDDLYPQPDLLIGFYKFDETQGTQVRDSSGAATYYDNPVYVNTSGILVDFDIETCWQPGIINNSLLFNGVNNYVFVDSAASNHLNTNLETNGVLSINVWVKLPDYNSVGVIYTLITNIENSFLIGSYILKLTDNNGDDNIHVRLSIRTDNNPGPIFTEITGTTKINDGKWHMITATIETNVAMKIYVDGQLDATTSLFGKVISTVNHANINTFFGKFGSEYYRGYMDEVRFYNGVLSEDDVAYLWKYGGTNYPNKSCIVLSANDGLNDNTSLILDSLGKLNNLSCKPLPYSILSGEIIAYSSSTTITGNNTKFTTELAVGDIIKLDDDCTIITIISDTEATLNKKGYDGIGTNKSHQSVLRKPCIMSYFDDGDNIKGYIDNNGNVMIGNKKPSTMLEIAGNSSDIPELTLTNYDEINTQYARKTAINFKGYNPNISNDVPVNLGHIETSHNGTLSDQSGIMKFFINTGSTEANILSITSNSTIGIGNQNNPLTQVHQQTTDSDKECEYLLQSSYSQNSPNYTVFDERSSIYFAGSSSINETTATNIKKRVLVSIEGSNDSDGTSLDLNGRLDIGINNKDNDNGVESKISLISTGNVGVNILKPVSLFEVSPEFRIGNSYDISTISGISSTLVTLSNNVFSSLIQSQKNLLASSGIAVINTGSTLVTCKIININTNNSFYTDTSLPVGYIGKEIHFHFAGLNVLNSTSNGFVGINTTTPNSSLHINGSYSTKVNTISDNTTILDDSYATVFVNTSGGDKYITIPDSTTYSGRIYNIKNINSNNVIINRTGSDLIESGSSYTLNPSKSITIQSDGTGNWWIIGGF